MCRFCRGALPTGTEDSKELFSRKMNLGAFGQGYMTGIITKADGTPTLSITIGTCADQNAKGVTFLNPIKFCPYCGRALRNTIPVVRDRKPRSKNRTPLLYEAIQARYLKGMSGYAIAKELKVPYAAVKYRIRKMKDRGDLPEE